MTGRVLPGFVDIQQTVGVEVADVEAAGQHRRFVRRKIIIHRYIGNRRVA